MSRLFNISTMVALLSLGGFSVHSLQASQRVEQVEIIEQVDQIEPIEENRPVANENEYPDPSGNYRYKFFDSSKGGFFVSDKTNARPVTRPVQGTTVTETETIYTTSDIDQIPPYNVQEVYYGYGYSIDNQFLWRAAVEAISSYPIRTISPDVGLLSSEWYVNDRDPNMRLKIDIYITGNTISPDSLKVSVFQQNKDLQGGWSDARSASKEKSAQLELLILKRSRDFLAQDLMLP